LKRNEEFLLKYYKMRKGLGFWRRERGKVEAVITDGIYSILVKNLSGKN